MWNRAKSLQIITHDNQIVNYPFDVTVDRDISQSYNWGSKVQVNSKDGLTTEIMEVIIIDLNDNPHSVYKNIKFFQEELD